MMRYLIAILFVLCSLDSFSQFYNTRELSDIGSLVQKSKLKLDFYQVNDSDGTIMQLGMPLFKKSVKDKFNSPLFDFCERCNLYLRLMNERDRYQYLKDNKIDVDCDKFFTVDSTCDFAIDNFDNCYSVRWNKDGAEICAITFEKNFSLIYGMNIQESQHQFQVDLLDTALVCKIPQRDTFLEEDSLFLINKGETYFLDNMKSDLYFNKKDSLPVCDTLYPLQSLSNIFGGLAKSDAVLEISQNLYGYRKANYSVSLERFVSYCLSHGCKFYLGIEEYKDHKIKATIIYENKDWGYNHLLYLNSLDDKFLSQPNCVINCELNTYIPTHNLKDLYNELNSNNK